MPRITGACCSKSDVRVTQLRLPDDGNTVGIVGLNTMFEQLLALSRTPDEAPDAELLGMVRRQNYVPSSAAAEALYAAALRREYATFYARRGHSRERIPWYPTISAGRCDGCGACVRSCPNRVFALAEGQAQVIEPFRCQVGCSACVRVCKPEAITFPPKEVLEIF